MNSNGIKTIYIAQMQCLNAHGNKDSGPHLFNIVEKNQIIFKTKQLPLIIELKWYYNLPYSHAHTSIWINISFFSYEANFKALEQFFEVWRQPTILV